MKIEELNKLSVEEETKIFLSIFGGVFFIMLFGESVYENKNGCFVLKDYDASKKLIISSVEKNENLLEIELKKVKYQNT
jgi:hypothetical protein